jgi:hypothetical protein
MTNLFRAEQQQRLEEMRRGPEPSDEWPRGCRGSRRPWLVFIGPSPGGKNKLDEAAEPLWNKSFTAPFHWAGGFKQSMRPLLSTLMPEASDTEATFLYAVYNLDSIEEPHANRVPIERMREGCPAVVSLLEKSPPRLIVPMEKECFKVLQEGLQGYSFETNNQLPLPVPIQIYKNAKRLHRKICGFRIEGAGPLRSSVVIKLPQHPAKILRADYAAACGKAVRNLFEQVAEASA